MRSGIEPTSSWTLVGFYLSHNGNSRIDPFEVVFRSPLVVKDPGIVTAVTWVRSLVQELLHAMGAAKKVSVRKFVAGLHHGRSNAGSELCL